MKLGKKRVLSDWLPAHVPLQALAKFSSPASILLSTAHSLAWGSELHALDEMREDTNFLNYAACKYSFVYIQSSVFGVSL